VLRVWAVCVGDKYADRDVQILQAMCRQAFSQSFIFTCLSDRKIAGVNSLRPPEVWPGWWTKLQLFNVARTDRNLYLDLDVIVTGSLDDLVSNGPLTMPKNWAQSGHGGWQSSVMSWARDYSYLANRFDVRKLAPRRNDDWGRYEGLHGDQCYITREASDVQPMSGVYSYKYHCRQSVPVDAKVVAFHGTPKPDDVKDSWVQKSRSIAIQG